MVRDINRNKTRRLTHSGEAAGGLGGASQRHVGAQRDLYSPRGIPHMRRHDVCEDRKATQRRGRESYKYEVHTFSMDVR